MKVFLDTNVIMEYLCRRANFTVAKEILDAAYLKAYDAYMSSGCFYTLSYLLSRFLKLKDIHEPENTKTVRDTMKGLLDYVGIVDLSEGAFVQGLEDLTFKDLEDSYQYYCAVENGCDTLVTFNMKHFKGEHNKELILMTPEEFAGKYLVKDKNDPKNPQPEETK